jgi:hypothetical protein
LQQHDCNQKKANDNVNYYNQNSHCKKTPSGPRPVSNSDLPCIRRNHSDGAEGEILTTPSHW